MTLYIITHKKPSTISQKVHYLILHKDEISMKFKINEQVFEQRLTITLGN